MSTLNVFTNTLQDKIWQLRTVAISRFRSNSRVNIKDAEDAETYYRRNIYYPFIDHCLKEFSECFPESSLSRFTRYNLHPDKVLQIKQAEIKAIEEFYEEDIPNKATFAAEVEMWKQKCKEFLQDDQIEKLKLVDALNIADKDYFPNIHEVLKLILTLTVGSVSCERSFSSMRRLKDWSRSTMMEDRLTVLALL